MQVKIPFFVDPKDGKQSVSLTLLVLSFVALLVASTFHIAKVTENTSSLMELFMTCSGLYFARKFSTKDASMQESITKEVTNLQSKE